MKKFNYFLSLAIVMLMSGILSAQPINYALTAVATQSGGGAGAFGPTAYNDNIIPAGVAQPWGWVTTGGNIEYTWVNPVPINAVAFYKADRPITSCNIEYWDGTAYQLVLAYSGGTANYDSVSFPTVQTTRLRFNNLTGSSNPNHREIKALYNVSAPNDAGVASLDSPAVFCSGVQPIVATIRNNGTTQIDSVDVHWSIGGVAQPVVKYVGLLDTLNGLGSTTAQVTLGTYTFPAGLTPIEVYTSNPNGTADTSNLNDTLRTSRGPALNGNFTINSAIATGGANFNSFSDFAGALNTFGVCGPVVATVAAGTYTESARFGNINGISSVNTVTIDGVDSSLAVIDGSANFYTIALDGASHITVQNLGIVNNNTSTMAMLLGPNARHNTISNCNIRVSLSSTSSLVNPIGTSNSLTTRSTNAPNVDSNIVSNNHIVGGYYGVYFYGGNGNLHNGNQILNNQLDSTYYYGIYVYYTDNSVVSGNSMDLTNRNNLNADGIYGLYTTNFSFEGNYIHAPDYGLYVSNSSTLAGPTTKKSQLINNMIISDTDFGTYFYSVDSLDIWHNSIVTNGTLNPALQIAQSNTYPVDDYDVRNNIFWSANTEALEILTTTDSIMIKFDNNIYHTVTGGALFRITNVNYADLNAYRLAQPLYNGASIEGDPLFLSPTNLKPIGTLANDTADNSVPVIVDIEGDVRPASGALKKDIGADEYTPSACTPPMNLRTSNPSLDSVTIAWDGLGNDYQYFIVPAGSPLSAGVITTLDSLRVGGLSASTSYDIYVREICGRGDTSFTVGPIAFNTANGLPYFEDFETFAPSIQGNPWPKGWTSSTSVDPNWESEDANNGNNENSTGTGPLWDHTNFGGPTNGMYLFLETSGGTVGLPAEVVTPPVYIDPAYNTFELSYWYFNHGANIDRMEVLIDTNGVQTLIATYTGQQQAAQTDPWLKGLHALNGFGGKSVQVIFRGYNVACCSGDIAIDDVKMDLLPPNTAGITEILSPSLPICPGAVSPVVGVRNSGTDTLTSVKVLWNVNGVLDSVLYTGTILPGAVTPVTLGVLNINSTTVYDLIIYTKDPNGMADANNNDDTLTVLGLRTGLSGNFTVDSTQAASATNFQSFTDMGDAFSAYGLCGPVTVDAVGPTAIYNNNRLALDGVLGGSSTNTITINGNGKTIVNNSTNANERSAVYVKDASYITFDSLNVDVSGGTYGWGYNVTNGTHHIEILNATIEASSTVTSFHWHCPVAITGSATSLTGATDAEYVTVDNNHLIGGYYGMSVYGNTSTRVSGMSFTNNIVDDFYQYGIYSAYVDSSNIEGNDIGRPNRLTVTTMYGIGLIQAYSTTVNANAIHNSHGSATSLTGTTYPMYITGDAISGQENYITNNLIYDINGNGTTYGIYDLGNNYTNYINNTVSLDHTTATGGTIRGFYQSAASTNSSFINNIISISHGGTGAKHGIYLNNTTTSLVCNYNDVYMNALAGVNSYGRWTADRTTLADWTLNTPNGANSFDVDPMYNNLAADSLVPSQALINAVALSSPNVTTDYYGVTRASGADIGAIEFDPPPFDDMTLRLLVEPFSSADSCYTAAEDVVVSLLNSGGNILDFTVTPLTVTMNVSGAGTAALTSTINTNAANGGTPLALGASIEVNIGTVNMTASGTYNFDGYLTMASDGIASNDSLVDSVIILPVNGGLLSGPDTICGNDTAFISTAGYYGQIQWQELVGATWTNIPGAVGNELGAVPTAVTSYRALACGTAPSDTVTVTPLIIPNPVAIGDTAYVTCGDSGIAIATVTSSQANAAFRWYTSPVGGTELDTNAGTYRVGLGTDSLFFTNTPGALAPTIDTLWVESVTAGGSNGPSIVITEMDPGGPDAIEIQNVSNRPIDVTGWTVAVSDGGTINTVNLNNQTLSGIMAPGATQYWTDGAVNPWGNNLFWNPGQGDWIMIIDAQGNLVDILIAVYPAATIATLNVTINGFNITNPIASGLWVGDGVNSTGLPTGSSMYRQGNADNNDNTDFIGNPVNLGVTNVGMLLPFKGGSCASTRVPVIVRVECLVGIADNDANIEAITISPNPSNGLFNLSINTQIAEEYNMTIRDIKGQLILNEVINANGNFTRDFDLSNLSKGVYYLRLQSETESKVEKIVIQ